jgi:hypothetical protein
MTTDTRAAEILSTVQGGVTVPLLRAAVAGFFISLPILIITAASAVNGYEFARKWWWACWLLAWTVTQVAWWLYDERGRARMQKAVIYAIEMQFGQDFDGDEVVGPPTPEENIRIQIEKQNENGAWEGTYSRPPVKKDQLRAFAIRVLEQGESTSIRTWVGPLNVFTREEYDAFVSWLDNQEGVDWKSDHDHRAGWTLSEDGKQILMKFLN